MAITSLTDLLLIAAAGAFGGYTYWTFSNMLSAIRAKAQARRR